MLKNKTPPGGRGSTATGNNPSTPLKLVTREGAKPKRPVLDPADPLGSAREFRRHRQKEGGELITSGTDFLTWSLDAPVYREIPVGELYAELYLWLERCDRIDAEGERVAFNPTIRKVKEIAEALRAIVGIPSGCHAPAWIETSDDDPEPFDLIPFPNGLYNLSARRLLPLDSNFFNRSLLPFAFDPNAPSPKHFLKFIYSIWPDDTESRDTVQEIFGLMLTPITAFQKLFLWVGVTRGGKGSLVRVMRQLVGQRNFAAITLASLGDRFGAQSIIGKTVCAISDAKLSARADRAAIVERLCAFSGEDSLFVQRKNLPDFEGLIATRFVILENELAEFPDVSGALAGRFIVVPFTKSFLGREDLGMEARFVPELPGILLWSLEGLRRLLKRGRFVQPKSGLALCAAIADLGSPVGAFVRERCIVGAGYVERGALFNAWCDWANANGHRASTSARFGRDLRAAVPGLKDVSYVGRFQRVYSGLRLVPGVRRAGKALSLNPSAMDANQ